ncbi:MAG: hypothetical protein RRY54_00330 [Angelakisella sp.]
MHHMRAAREHMQHPRRVGFVPRLSAACMLKLAVIFSISSRLRGDCEARIIFIL